MVQHAPYFVGRYGSLAIWSCQGLENSHHAAKDAYQRHTQHSCGKSRKSPLLQTYQHWYRIIAHRFRNKENVIASTDIDSQLQGLQQGVRLQLTQVHLLIVFFGVQNARG